MNKKNTLEETYHPMPYIKGWISYWLDDPRVFSLDSLSYITFESLHLMAGWCGRRGELILGKGYVMTTNDIANWMPKRYKWTGANLQKLLEKLEKLKLMHIDKATGAWVVTDFAEQQIDWKSKQKLDKERKRKSRANQKKQKSS